MKKLFILLLSVLLCAAFLTSCKNNKTEVALTVFAAASLTDVLNEISENYKEVMPKVAFYFNYDSSGKLQTQIENGAEADLFISAGQKQMDALSGSFIDDTTRKDLLVNKVVLITPLDNAKGIASFEDVLTAKVKLIALGNEAVPVGQYSQEIFKFLNGWDIVKAKASFGSNVREVLSQVESASVDCGVVYSTDALISNKVKVAAAAPQGSHQSVTYPAAIINDSKNAKAAADFLNFLSSQKAKEVFKKYGFEVIE